MKPVGYFGLSNDNTLIKDMTETFGECLERITPSDTFWLLARIGADCFLENPSDNPPTDEAEEVVNRLDELTFDEKQQLIRALCDQSHPVGYYSLDPNNSLIKDMIETWGETLGRMDENDADWLIGQIADVCWEELGDGASEEIEEASDRLHELNYSEKTMLMSALVQ